jgi:hypothetical protein
MEATITMLWGCIGPAFKDRSRRVYQMAVNGTAGSNAMGRNIGLVLNTMSLQKVYAKGAELWLRHKVLKMAEQWGTVGV